MFCGNENYHSPWLLNISMSLYIVSEVSLCLVAHYVLRGFCGPCAKGTGVVTWRDRSFPLQGPSFLTNLLSPLSSNIDDNDTSLYINTTSLTLTLQFKQWILLTSSIRNVWRTVRRICIFISRLKGLRLSCHDHDKVVKANSLYWMVVKVYYTL